MQQEQTNIRATGLVIPNAKFLQVVEAAAASVNNNVIVLLCSTNDVLKDDLKNTHESSGKILSSFRKKLLF